MNMKTIGAALLLLGLTTLLAVGSFHLYYADFFYLRKVYRSPTQADRARLLRIAERLDYHDQRNTAISMMLGEALMRVGETDLAARIISVQVGLNPGDLGILRAYADALAAQGRAEEADRIFRRILDALRKGKHKETRP